MTTLSPSAPAMRSSSSALEGTTPESSRDLFVALTFLTVSLTFVGGLVMAFFIR